MFKQNNKFQALAKQRVTLSKGVTLVELLVVVAIIGTLATVVLVQLNTARIQARDARRVSDLHNIQIALEFYYNKHRTYLVTGTGWGGGGQGWFGWEDGGSYAKSVSRGLYEAGLLSSPVVDGPQYRPEYMIYLCNSGQQYAISATKEDPTSDDTVYIQTVCSGPSVASIYGKNYAVGN